MKTVGIIAEYNPFHKGHAFHIEEAKRLSGADHCVIIMSGDFVQRGEPAIFNKALRTQMALENGADLVIMLPALYSCSSAEIFARGAISLLVNLNVDAVCFGSECGDITAIYSIAQVLAHESAKYQTLLKAFLRNGVPFASARVQAVAACADELDQPLDNIEEIMSAPNNILAIEYMKSIISLGSTMEAYTIERRGMGYNETRLSSHSFSSATGIRSSVEKKQDISSYIPSNCMEILSEHATVACPLFLDDFSDLLNYAICSHTCFTQFADVNEEISNAILTRKGEFHTFKEWVSLLTNKTYTAGRIRRSLMHIALGFSDDLFQYWKANGYTPYIRVLGMGKNAGSILKNKNDNAQIISRASDFNQLYSETKQLFTLDQKVYEITRMIYEKKYGFALSTFPSPMVHPRTEK